MKYKELNYLGNPEDIIEALNYFSELLSILPAHPEFKNIIKNIKYKPEKEIYTMNIERLRAFHIHRNNELDTIVAVRADLKSLAGNYSDLKIDIPEWITYKINEVEKEIKNLTVAQKEARIAKLKSQRTALLSRDERRATIEKEIEELEKEM